VLAVVLLGGKRWEIKMSNIPLLGNQNINVNDFLRGAPLVPNPRLNSMAVREEQLFMHLLFKEAGLLEQAMDSGITYRCFQNRDMGKLYAIAAEYFQTYNGALLTRPALDCVLAKTMTPEEAGNFRTKYDDATTQFGIKNTDYQMLRENIESRFVQRQAWAVCQKFVTELAESTDNQKKLVSQFQQFASEISIFGDSNSFVQATSLEDLIESKIRKQLIDRRDHPENYVGIKCLYPEIDADYNGFKKRRYMVITATEGGGKSTFMINLGFNMAYGGNNVVYVTIEVNNEDVGYKLVSLHSNVNQNRIQRGGSGAGDGLAPFIMSELDAGMKSIIDLGIGKRFHLIQVLENTSRDTICRLVQRIRAFQRVDVVIIDYLQVVGREVNFGERVDQAIADVSNKFRAWGRQNNILMITANQIKADKGRKLQEDVKDDDVLITKGDTSGSKEISGAADYMFGIWVPRSKDKMIVFSTKNRHGKDAQKYTMSFDPNTGRVAQMGEFGESEDITLAVKSKKERDRIRKNFSAGDNSTMMDIPGTLVGEEPPNEVSNPKLSWAGNPDLNESYLDP